MCSLLQLGHLPGLAKRFLLLNTYPQDKHMEGSIKSLCFCRATVRAIWSRWSYTSFSRILSSWETSLALYRPRESKTTICCRVVNSSGCDFLFPFRKASIPVQTSLGFRSYFLLVCRVFRALSHIMLFCLGPRLLSFLAYAYLSVVGFSLRSGVV